MAIGKEFYQLLRLYGGISVEYRDLIETDFSAANGAAYSPPEEGDFRRINVTRAIQFLAQAGVFTETFQTSAATIRFPANTVTESTNDAGDGRLFVIVNSGTGNILIQDYAGTLLFTLKPGIEVIVHSKYNNQWSFYTARQLSFDNSTNGFVADNVQGAIEEINVSASPGLTWGRSGNIASGTNAWLLNDGVPSNVTGREIFLTSARVVKVFIANEGISTFSVGIYEHDGVTYTLLGTVSLVAARKQNFTVSYSLTTGKELAMRVDSGSCKNIVAGVIIKGSL